ncbi:MAG: hypothetical protein GX977_01505 [Firmicutes bacterium]|nr:hypothetical protein [Bacillota bacterium]
MRTPRAMLIMSLGIMLLAFGAKAQGSDGMNRGVVVSPARLVATVETGDRLPPVRVRNATDYQMEVVVYVGRGEHRWNGSPIYFDSPPEREWGATYLKLDKTSLQLEPGEAETVIATVGDLTGVQGGLYPVIFFEISPSSRQEGAAAVSRLAVLTLLQVAGSRPSDLAVSSLDIQQASPGEAIGVFPVITNRGKVHTSCSGYIEIAGSTGDVNTRLPVQPVTVLPGCQRQLALWWQPQELAVGTYYVNAYLSGGGCSIEADQWAFRIIQPYALATRQGDLVSWYPDRVYAAQATPFRLVVHNSGTDAWRAWGELLVMDPAGGVKAQVSVDSEEVEPGGSGQITGLLPPLAPGHYTMRVSLSSEGVPLLETERTLDVMAVDAIAQR